MSNERADAIPRSPYPDRLPQVLLSFLDAVVVQQWPGGDGLTVEDALSCYPAAAVAGQVPDRRQLCERYPDLGAEVDAFFGTHLLSTDE